MSQYGQAGDEQGMEITAPVACTLTSGDFETRRGWIQRPVADLLFAAFVPGVGSLRVTAGD